MRTLRFKETSIRETTTGGKAGKGCNRTASFAVTDHYFIEKRGNLNRPCGRYFSYVRGNPESRKAALRKALDWCAEIDASVHEVLHGIA